LPFPEVVFFLEFLCGFSEVYLFDGPLVVYGVFALCYVFGYVVEESGWCAVCVLAWDVVYSFVFFCEPVFLHEDFHQFDEVSVEVLGVEEDSSVLAVYGDVDYLFFCLVCLGELFYLASDCLVVGDVFASFCYCF